MSSLAATQADGYYLPPEYYESGAKSKNEWYAKQQKKEHNQKTKAPGAPPVVRFELADPCVCRRCQARIGRGTRFNATKHTTTEKYFSTAIIEFRTTCRRCGEGEFVIRTDPQHRGFSYAGDLRRQERNWNADTVGGITVEQNSDDDQEQDNDSASPVNRLEKQALGLQKAISERKQLEQLIQLNQKTAGDDVAGNAKLRDEFRKDRHKRKRLRKDADQKGWKESVDLQETTLEDTSHAKSTVFGNGRKNETKRWKRVRLASIFDTKTVPAKPDRASSWNIPLAGSANISPTLDQSNQTIRKSEAQPRPKRQLMVVPGKRGAVTTLSCERNATTSPQVQSALESLADYGSSSDDDP